MVTNKDEEDLFQLKLDYLEFMVQIQDWHDPNITIIVYALLMEQKKITQSQLIELTGLSRTTISETLSLIINDPRGIPVLQSRKRGDKKKYYYCPLSFDEYIKRLFGGVFKSININLEFIPKLLYRMKNLNNFDAAVEHAHDFLSFFYKYNYKLSVVMESYDLILTRYFEDFDKKSKHFDLIPKKELNLNMDQIIAEVEQFKQEDSFDSIKRDFMNEFINLGQGSSSGTNKEIVYVFLLLYLENNPISQDDIRKLTKSRAAAISEALSLLERQKFVNVVKKPNDRKKYYEPQLTIYDFITSRLKLSNHKITQISLIMKSRFIPELRKIDSEVTEKQRLLIFFEETARYHEIIGVWIKDMLEFILNQLN